MSPLATLRERLGGARRSPGARGSRAAVFLAAAIALAAPCASASASASASAPRPPLVVPPVGPLYNALSVAWWNYVLGQPAATNPLLDPTGATCATGQDGPVFFLVGGSGSATFTRDRCTVRGPRALFFPLLNAFDVHTPGDGLDTPRWCTRTSSRSDSAPTR